MGWLLAALRREAAAIEAQVKWRAGLCLHLRFYAQIFLDVLESGSEIRMEQMMLKTTTIVLLTAAMAVPALAGPKVEGNTLLKDFQPAGVGDKHQKKSKHQVFDLTFDASGKEYICRTDADKSVNATNFVVGSSVHYELDGKKMKIKTPEDKKVECQIVRVSLVSSSEVPTPAASTSPQ
jgi:hypothetical protein